MPELPEVQTTVNGLNKVLKNHTIEEVWTDYFKNTKHKRKDTIKNEQFFKTFRKKLIGQKFVRAERRGKNVLIHLSNHETVLIHMKMTGHLLYGRYIKQAHTWKSDEENLKDPFNQFIHFLIRFDNGRSLAFSDMRKFATVRLSPTSTVREIADIKLLGPEANDLKLDWKTLKTRLLKRPNGKVKTVLMDQTVVAGIGNIYSDEILWAAGIHPERLVKNLTDENIRTILWQARRILAFSIIQGGDSMSDYRNIYGERGGFQKSHKAYRQTGKQCQKRGCPGHIVRKMINGRSAHFCNIHQK